MTSSDAETDSKSIIIIIIIISQITGASRVLLRLRYEQAYASFLSNVCNLIL